MILVIDNYDSFVFNLARYFVLAGEHCEVVRNDQIDLAGIERMAPRAIVISPGPCAPEQSGICVDAIKTFGAHIPVLGVCLGHQCIGAAYGDEIVRSPAPVHGRASIIRHDGKDLFDGLPDTFEAGRYHSLIVQQKSNSPLVAAAHSEDGVLMALRHPDHPVYGIQFHPESVLTPQGHVIVQNFIAIAREWHAARQRHAA